MVETGARRGRRRGKRRGGRRSTIRERRRGWFPTTRRVARLSEWPGPGCLVDWCVGESQGSFRRSGGRQPEGGAPKRDWWIDGLGDWEANGLVDWGIGGLVEERVASWLVSWASARARRSSVCASRAALSGRFHRVMKKAAFGSAATGFFP